MTSEIEPAQRSARRVLALLDASRHSLAALRAAVELATLRQEELVALFVEDMDLLHSAGFPFALEVGGHSGLTRPLSPEQVESSLGRQRERVTHALAEAVKGRQIHHSLRVSRGRIVTEALSLAAPGDLVVLGKASSAGHYGGVRLGSTCRALILQAPCMVLIWDERRPLNHGPLRVLSDHVPEGLLGLPLCDRVEQLPAQNAASLERTLADARSGALLLHRAELDRLCGQDPDLLARIPVPIIVVPDPS
ncbi:universal stress protein [Kineobactrum sediminis]|nr:universal stress protein [Kineobactrum sediminis]